jgi:hypothetical protein
MRDRAAQKLNPKMGCMGAEDPSRAFRSGLYRAEVATLLARALLDDEIVGVVTAPGATLAKYRASGTTTMPRMTVRTNVTAPHSRRSTAQSTSR